ncbi:MAG: hypothetical protein AAB817_01600 [Patescibacteria group bacterium]
MTAKILPFSPPPRLGPSAAVRHITDQAAATVQAAHLHRRWIATVLDSTTGEVTLIVTKKRHEAIEAVKTAITQSKFFIGGTLVNVEIRIELDVLPRRWRWRIRLQTKSADPKPTADQPLLWQLGGYQAQQLITLQ